MKYSFKLQVITNFLTTSYIFHGKFLYQFILKLSKNCGNLFMKLKASDLLTKFIILYTTTINLFL